MQKDLGNYRKSYEKSALIENSIPENPMVLFQKWFDEVEASESIEEPNAMTLSTIGLDEYPKSRVVLLKQISLERQIIVKGKAQKTSKKISDAYFQSRPKGSRLGAIVSQQSSVIDSRDVLDKKLEQLQKEYSNKDVKRPDFWGGYIVKPSSMEFWQGRILTSLILIGKLKEWPLSLENEKFNTSSTW